MFLFFNISNPMIWVLILAAIVLLFGASKLPELAKALGKSKQAFKDGLSEGDEDKGQKPRSSSRAALSAVDDEALFEEARRRARLRVDEAKGQK